MNQIESLLISIGLTKQEAHCYLTLYELQEAQTGELSKASGIATANIYPVLNNLIKKGLVSYRMQNNIKIFMASPPDSFSDFVEEGQRELDEQKEKVKEAISQLKREKIKKEPQSNYKYYEGVSGIKSMWHEITSALSTLDKNIIIKVHSSKKGTFERLIGFYDEFHKVRLRLRLKYRLILTFEAKSHGEKRKKQNAEVRYMDLKNETQWGIVGNIFFMYYAVGKKPRSFLILDEKFAKSFEFVFDQLWEIARP